MTSTKAADHAKASASHALMRAGSGFEGRSGCRRSRFQGAPREDTFRKRIQSCSSEALSFSADQSHPGQSCDTGCDGDVAVRREIKQILQTETPRPFAENAMRGVVAGNRLKQIVGTSGRDRFGCLLSVIAVLSQITIGIGWCNFLRVNGLHGWPADVHSPPLVRCRPYYRARRNFGLKNRWHRLWVAR